MGFGIRYAIILAGTVAAGCAFWSVVNLLCGVGEAWDAPNYLTLLYPLSLGLGALLGYLFPDQGWQLGGIVVLTQFPVMMVWEGFPFGPLMPLGIMFLLVLSIPGAVAAAIGANIRRAMARRRARRA